MVGFRRFVERQRRTEARKRERTLMDSSLVKFVPQPLRRSTLAWSQCPRRNFSSIAMNSSARQVSPAPASTRKTHRDPIGERPIAAHQLPTTAQHPALTFVSSITLNSHSAQLSVSNANLLALTSNPHPPNFSPFRTISRHLKISASTTTSTATRDRSGLEIRSCE